MTSTRRRTTRTQVGAALVAALALFCTASPPSAGERYDNTFMKDFIMDAPWRVTDATTAIPLTIVLKDCDTDDIRELHWIRCWDVTSGETILWDHDFGDETIGNDAYESNFWTYITTVTEGHPSPRRRNAADPREPGVRVGRRHRPQGQRLLQGRLVQLHGVALPEGPGRPRRLPVARRAGTAGTRTTTPCTRTTSRSSARPSPRSR